MTLTGGGSARFGPDPQPGTQDRQGALLAVLDSAQWSHEAKAAAWRTLTSQHLSPAAMLADLHAQGIPPGLHGALAELLTAA